MKFRIKNFRKYSVALIAIFVAYDCYAVQMPNPRTANDSGVASHRGGNASAVPQSLSRNAQRRASASVAGRSAVSNGVKNVSGQSGRVSARYGTGTIVSRSDANVSRAAVGVTAARSGISGARSASNVNAGNANVSRASASRATAIFDDVSKIGGGYAACRDAYATCMDQFCAKANDTYRRCLCSSRYTEFRNTESALDQAKILLQQFEDNNLNAVDKSAAEVGAMYSATVGEQAIKNDTSGAQKVLNEIGDLLAGRKKAVESANAEPKGLISLDFSSDLDDVWGGNSSNSIFDTDNGTDLSLMDGVDLFNSASRQCAKVVKDSCDSTAVFNMSTSSYNILISQDCNAYEKKVNSQREAVMQTVRTAEKYLREARLEEYRAHNSANVNECVAAVKTAITTDSACGPNYSRCLDYTGAYIDSSTGEPIYSTRFYNLSKLIKLDGVSSDVLGQNAAYNQFLDSKRMYATAALDKCRDVADVVWTEFKRSALIEIAQAQDAKVEEVKMSCVATMKDCYDTQSGALKSFDEATAKMVGALSAYAAKEMCADKVTACATLYNNDNCQVDNNGKVKGKNGGQCGLSALLNFVNTVDDVRVAEGCASSLESYAKELCTDSNSGKGYPWKCRLKNKSDLEDVFGTFVNQNCSFSGEDNMPSRMTEKTKNLIADITESIAYQMSDACEEMGGFWISADYVSFNTYNTYVDAFYSLYYGGQATDTSNSYGKCIKNSRKLQCLQYNDGESAEMAKYDDTSHQCSFTEEWYQLQCRKLGNGYYADGICYLEEKQ